VRNPTAGRERFVKIVDLSAPIEPSPPEWPAPLRTDILYADHRAGAEAVESLFGVPSRLLRDGEGWAVETFTNLGTHNSTHVDAPWHYNSSVHGDRAQTIDELPLEWFFSDGVVLDMAHKADGDPMTAAEAQAELARIGHELKGLDIVLVRTGRDEFYSQPDYLARGCGVSAEATRWLWEQGVRVMGIDAWGWDAPLHMQAERARDEDRTGVFWAAHQADIPYCQIERLVNLSALPPRGFKLACFPLKVAGGSAGPARVVGLLDEG
jgi:kynurenine formamidase